jgi:hypothetical protein
MDVVRKKEQTNYDLYREVEKVREWEGRKQEK